MSTENEKTNEAAQTATTEDSPAADVPDSESAALDTAEKTGASASKSIGPVILFFLIGFAASLVVGWVIFPKLLYSQKKQPIDFNHVIHMEAVDAGCESCHFFREDGSFSGVPKLEQCEGCHSEQIGESDNEAKFVQNYVSKGIEVPWLIYSRQPDCVFFSHAAHIKMAKMDCATCHGPMGEAENLRVYEENRITGYSRDIWGKNIAGLKKNTWDRMKMDDCAECHADQTDISKKEKGTSALSRLFTNIVNIPFPSSTKTGKKSSVQTQKEACFVCHK